MINKLLENKLRSFIPLNAKGLIIHLYFYLGSNGTISNLKNKANYSLKSGPIFKDHNVFVSAVLFIIYPAVYKMFFLNK